MPCFSSKNGLMSYPGRAWRNKKPYWMRYTLYDIIYNVYRIRVKWWPRQRCLFEPGQDFSVAKAFLLFFHYIIYKLYVTYMILYDFNTIKSAWQFFDGAQNGHVNLTPKNCQRFFLSSGDYWKVCLLNVTIFWTVIDL